MQVYVLGVTKTITADQSSCSIFKSTCNIELFLLTIYQSFYPLQFVASFKQVTWVGMLNPASGAVGRAGLKNYMYNTMYQCKVRDSVSVILSTRNGFSDENNLSKKDIRCFYLNMYQNDIEDIFTKFNAKPNGYKKKQHLPRNRLNNTFSINKICILSI